MSIRRFWGYLGCAWMVLAEVLFGLGLLVLGRVISVSALLIGALIVLLIVAIELAGMSVRRRRV